MMHAQHFELGTDRTWWLAQLAKAAQSRGEKVAILRTTMFDTPTQHTQLKAKFESAGVVWSDVEYMACSLGRALCKAHDYAMSHTGLLLADIGDMGQGLPRSEFAAILRQIHELPRMQVVFT